MLGGRIGVLAEVEFRDRHESRGSHADRAANDAFLGKTGVEHPVHAEAVLQPQRRRMHAALAAHVFAEDQHARIDRQLMLERAAYRGDQVDARTLRFGTLVARRLEAGAAQAALLLQIEGAVRASSENT